VLACIREDVVSRATVPEGDVPKQFSHKEIFTHGVEHWLDMTSQPWPREEPRNNILNIFFLDIGRYGMFGKVYHFPSAY
jgi:hypothetical protein